MIQRAEVEFNLYNLADCVVMQDYLALRTDSLDFLTFVDRNDDYSSVFNVIEIRDEDGEAFPINYKIL